ncbi:MAG: FMN-binding protein [Candidatus Cloacimonetes bacterium]|nr:FMN-binding protein [Candidatus Cloacimonadota bacterium]
MMYYLKLALVLLIIAGVAAGILAFVNSKTAPIIVANKLANEIEARKKVMEGLNFSEDFDFVKKEVSIDKPAGKCNPLKIKEEKTGSTFLYYEVVGKDTGKVLGYTFMSAKSGYSSIVKTMVGVDTTYTINKIRVISQSETPGLGAKCQDEDFMAQFDKKNYDAMKVTKSKSEIETAILSITGATITTRTITESLNADLKTLAKVTAKGGE